MISQVKRSLQNMPWPSKEGTARFRQAFERIADSAFEKIRIQAVQLGTSKSADQLALLNDLGRRWAKALLAAYCFQLRDALVDETIWLLTTLKSRGISTENCSHLMQSWSIAIHTHLGVGLAKSAADPIEWLRSHLLKLEEMNQQHPTPATYSAETNKLAEALFENDEILAMQIIQAALKKQNDVADVLEQLVFPVLSKIGELWSENRISVSAEHLATGLLRSLLERLVVAQPNINLANLSLFVACVPHEEHEIGSLVLSLYLKHKGWSVRFYGRSTPEEDLLQEFIQKRPRVIMLSISLLANLPAAERLIAYILEADFNVSIWVGGRTAELARSVFKSMGVHLAIGNFRELEAQLRKMVF